MTPLHKTLCYGLPYGLKCQVIDFDGKTWESVELTNISTKSSYESIGFIDNNLKDPMPAELGMVHIDESVKPILRDLSELDKEIELGAEIVKKFNEVSDRIKCKIKIPV